MEVRTMSNVINMKDKQCVICDGYIEPLRDSEGKVVWSGGHNAEPIDEGRCCDTCNNDVVIPTRMAQMMFSPLN